jgi:hypothetical protein
MALGALILHATTPDRIGPLTEDVIRSLRINIGEMLRRAGPPRPSRYS